MTEIFILEKIEQYFDVNYDRQEEFLFSVYMSLNFTSYSFIILEMYYFVFYHIFHGNFFFSNNIFKLMDSNDLNFINMYFVGYHGYPHSNQYTHASIESYRVNLKK